MDFIVAKLLPLGLYPLGLSLLLQWAALLGRRRRCSPWLASSAVALLWIPSTPWVSRQLTWGLEQRSAALMPATIPAADAIVVLGGGLRPALPPRRGVEVNEAGDRLLTGLALLRQGRAPLVVFTGGKIKLTATDPGSSEARSAATLAAQLGLRRAQMLLLEQPRNTAEEAQAVRQLARQRGWQRLLLITSATHMPRALATFERVNSAADLGQASWPKTSGHKTSADQRLRLIPVACDFQLPDRSHWGRPSLASVLQDVLPDAASLHASTVALKEHLGLLIYRLRGWS